MNKLAIISGFLGKTLNRYMTYQEDRGLATRIEMASRVEGADGLEVCYRLKSYDETKGIYIIIVSAKGMNTDILAGLDAGANEYIVKPFKIMPLMKKIDQILE